MCPPDAGMVQEECRREVYAGVALRTTNRKLAVERAERFCEMLSSREVTLSSIADAAFV